MWATLYFSNFDPFEGEIDYSSFSWAEETDRLLLRARDLLSDLNKEDIDEAISLIDWMYSQTYSQERVWERLGLEAASYDEDWENKDEKESRFSISIDEFEALEKEYDLTSLDGNRLWSWSQFYALCTLNLIGEAVEEAIYLNRDFKDSRYLERRLTNNIGYYLFQAYEMVSVAERKGVEENFTEHVEKQTLSKISMRNQSAAIQRHAPVRKLKDEFITWYRENEEKGVFQSKSQAATKFFANCSEEKRKLLAPTNAVRTLLGALKDHERRRASSAKSVLDPI